MASVASELIEEVTAHAQSDSLEDAREICADGTYFPNNLHTNNKYAENNLRTKLTLFIRYGNKLYILTSGTMTFLPTPEFTKCDVSHRWCFTGLGYKLP